MFFRHELSLVKRVLTRWFACCLLGGLLLCSGCKTSDLAIDQDSFRRPDSATGKVHAVATVGMVADLVRNVGGEHVEVTQVMGAGVDPHLYKATRDDVEILLRGEIVFYSGLLLEGKLASTLNKLSRRKPVYPVTSRIPEDQLFQEDGAEGHPDPHVWMDVGLWSTCVDTIAERLIQYDPMHADDYRANAKSYQIELEQLHVYGKEVIGSIPQSSRVLVTSHDAFNYFGSAYDLQVIGVQGISTDSEAGLQHINELVDLLVSQDVKAVFVESSVPAKNITALVNGSIARGHDLRIGGELYSDAMGTAGTYEGTYIGMLDHNFTMVSRALGGTAPARGLNGKLSQGVAE
jgi:manganese/zinc/iron transport system substrate-binding protein